MRATLTLTSRGVVTLPSKLRQAMGLKADDQLIAETTPQGLLLRPAVTLPVEIYTDERLREFEVAEAEVADYFHSRVGSRVDSRAGGRVERRAKRSKPGARPAKRRSR